MKENTKRQTGFTLIELLVVIAIIAMLIGMLSVGLRKTKIISMNLRQKSVFHAMEISLELFSKDFGDYPDSQTLPDTVSANQISGAQHLVEALVGRDEEGLEPQTNWYAPDPTLYMPAGAANPLTQAGYNYYDSTQANSRDRRKGPYGEFKHIELFTIYDLWQGENGTSMIYDSQSAAVPARRAPVFTDAFRRFRVDNPAGSGTVRVGMPILYFKANRAASRSFRLNQTAQTEVTDPVLDDMRNWTYNYLDNAAVVNLPSLADTTQEAPHYVDPDDDTKSKAKVFYEQITQRSEPDRPYYKPFNANTFILITAGWDGIYGTDDDVTSFNY